MTIEKLISFHIERQFPAIYREEGQELVQFMKEYYKFLEQDTGQSLYNGRRIFEYRDIDTTLERMLLFFKNKYLADLPFDETTIRIIVKNIMDLYRRKGTQGGLELFFRLFFDADIKTYYPARDILKPSDSNWKKGTYLQLKPNSGLFSTTKTEGTFTYSDIVGKTIVGETSRAKATVDKINFILINNSLVPIIFIDDIAGAFIGLEGIISEINGVPVNFGIINGSFTAIAVNTTFKGTSGNNVGDLVTFRTNPDGIGSTGIVTGVTENFTGIVSYTVADGGWGYSIDSTRLLVSNQIVFVENADFSFRPYQNVRDQFDNEGIVIGQSAISIGLKADDVSEFTSDSIIYTIGGDPLKSVGVSANTDLITTLERAIELASGGIEPQSTLFNQIISGSRRLGDIDNSGTITANDALELAAYFAGVQTNQDIIDYIEGPFSDYIRENSEDYFTYPVKSLKFSSVTGVVAKNDTSPGLLYPDTDDTSDVIVGDLENKETVRLIFDIIGNFVDVQLDAINYNDPPALLPMSGNTDPVIISTRLDEAFSLDPVEIGTIIRFDNINPGTDYVNDVFAIAYDDRLTLFERKNQQITLENIPATLSIGNIVSQNGIGGKVVSIQDKTITIVPYTYYGFNASDPILFGGNLWNIVGVSSDFNSNIAGFNATIDTVTDFAIGKITNVNVIDSGYGYIHNSVADIIDSAGVVAARGIISARGQGSTGGFWASLNSHLNGYVQTGDVQTYFSSGKYVQDSNYYQEYSYEVQSTLGLNSYETSLKEIAHVAGTKVFGKFNLEEGASTEVSVLIEITS